MPHLRSVFHRLFNTKMTTDGSQRVSGLYSMAFVTVPDESVAKKIAHGIVQNKLAACVNIIPKVTSVYEWKGKIEEDAELLLMIKTRTSRMDELSQYVREHHPAEVAEVISAQIDKGNAAYLNWIGDIVADKNK